MVVGLHRRHYDGSAQPGRASRGLRHRLRGVAVRRATGGIDDDFDDSFDWTSVEKLAAAAGFVLAIDEAIGRILVEPSRFPTTAGGCHYCRLRRYPFRIVFRDERERIVVIAVAHAKRQTDDGDIASNRKRQRLARVPTKGIQSSAAPRACRTSRFSSKPFNTDSSPRNFYCSLPLLWRCLSLGR